MFQFKKLGKYITPHSQANQEALQFFYIETFLLFTLRLSDLTGWFIFVVGYIFEAKVVPGHLHAPNWDDDETFFKQFFQCYQIRLHVT